MKRPRNSDQPGGNRTILIDQVVVYKYQSILEKRLIPGLEQNTSKTIRGHPTITEARKPHPKKTQETNVKMLSGQK